MIGIRPFSPPDLEALYAISLATGHEGKDASHLYVDGNLMGHIYAAPYALLEPTLTFVAEDDQGVAGFVLGTADTDAWFQRLESDWWPELRARYDDPGAVASPEWSPDQRRAFMIHHPSPTPAAVSKRYPAHMHLNLAPRIQGRGIGSRLATAWITAAKERGVEAIHVGANRANHRALQFWSRQGFNPLPDLTSASGRTVWMGRP